jgi:hypothetical protein
VSEHHHGNQVPKVKAGRGRVRTKVDGAMLAVDPLPELILRGDEFEKAALSEFIYYMHL